MSSIKGIAPAPGPAQAAAYAGKTEEEDILAPVLCFTVIEFDEGEPDEVVGQIFDGQCITEATSVDDEEGFGLFVGYFALTKRGKAQAKEACEAYREAEGERGKKEEVEEEEEIEDEIENEEDEEDEEEDDFGDFIGGADEEEGEEEGEDDEEDDQ